MAEHRTDALQVFGVMPEITKLYGDRYALTFRCNPSDNTEGWYYDNKDNIFADFGTLMDAGFGDSPATPNPDSTWPNQSLVRHRLEYPQGQDTPVVVFEYETLTDSFVQEAADKVDYELNGLRRVTRSVIAKDGTSYGKTVGTSTIEHTEHGYPTLTLTLASAIQDQEQPSESGSVRIIETWLQSGLLDVSTSSGPDRIPGTTRVTHVSIGTPSVPTGSLIESKDINQGGFVRYIRTTLQGTITGVKQTYRDSVSVEVPGTVDCTTKAVSGTYTRTFNGSPSEVTISGTLAVPSVTPRRQKRVQATVTVEITTTPPDTGSTAYDLGSISCSVSSTNTAINGSVGNIQSTTGGVNVLTGSQNFSANSRIQTYPGCYLLTTSSEGTVSYLSSSTVSGGAPYSIETERKTYCDGTGSTEATGYITTGIIKRESRPVLVLQDGTTYYEVITWSV